MRTKDIRVAIAGVGNCCQALLTGIEYYRQTPDDMRGLMNEEIGGYRVTDVVPVAAFDVSANKVGKDLNEAIYGAPNKAYRYPGVEMKRSGVTVQMGPVLDGNPPHLAQEAPTADEPTCDVAAVL